MLSTGGIIPCLPFFCKGVSAPLVMHAVWCTVFRRGVALEENVESRENQWVFPPTCVQAC